VLTEKPISTLFGDGASMLAVTEAVRLGVGLNGSCRMLQTVRSQSETNAVN